MSRATIRITGKRAWWFKPLLWLAVAPATFFSKTAGGAIYLWAVQNGGIKFKAEVV